MAGTKTSALTPATALADADLIPMVDVSDTSQAPTGSTKRMEASDVRDYIAVRDENYAVWRSEAVGDGVADDTAELNAAAIVVGAVGGRMILDRAHLVSGTVTVPSGVIVVGHDGHSSVASVVESSATSGPVFLLPARCTGIEHVRIAATAGRRAASTTTGHGILMSAGDIATPPINSRMRLFDVEIIDQPTDGLHTIGSIELSKFEQVSVYDCVRHGFVHDGGTVAGYTNLTYAPFIANWKDCRAFECGGQAIIVQTTGGLAAFSLTLDHFEALGCAWDSTKRYGGSVYECIVGGRGVLWIQPDIEDQQYANSTTTVGGHAKTPRATPSSGIVNTGQATQVIQPFFSSLVQSWRQEIGSTGLAMWWPNIVNGAYATDQAPAIDIASSNCLDIEVHYLTSMTTGATTVLANRSVNARIVADGIPKIGDAFSTADTDLADGTTPVAVTIASDILTTTNRRTQVAGQGAAADDLSTLRLASGINGAIGMDVFLFRGSQDITIKHGTANIRTTTAADVVMTATANTVLHFAYDGTNWIQV